MIKQFEQMGSHANRYDVTVLVNGLPLVQIELKKRGVAIREAFNQVHRYSKERFNSEHSLYNFRQKTHRLQAGAKGFNVMFAVSRVDAAKRYYESFRKLQQESEKTGNRPADCGGNVSDRL